MELRKASYTSPGDEKFDMALQIRRASRSITANIAEGYGRYHFLDSLKFYSNARGSLNGVLGHLINARVLNYCDDKYFESFYMLIQQTEKTLNGYMRYVPNRKQARNRMDREQPGIHPPSMRSIQKTCTANRTTSLPVY
jgi:four helix bundle protein